MARPLTEIHNHDVDGPFVILHVRNENRIGSHDPGHAFGPFTTREEAQAFHDDDQLDTCHQYLVDLIPATGKD